MTFVSTFVGTNMRDCNHAMKTPKTSARAFRLNPIGNLAVKRIGARLGGMGNMIIAINLGLVMIMPMAMVLTTVMVAMLPQNAAAHHLLPKHTLKCSENFPCPKAIQPRMHFWIEVFRSWGAEMAILHDPQRPERVYAVYDTGQGCNRAVRKVIKREREKIQTALRDLAAAIESGQSLNQRAGKREKHLAGLFPSKNPREIRRAANNIRCQGGVRDSFVEGLIRYQGYRPMVDQVLQSNGLPPEIRYLPFVESAYNPAAYSKAGAAGMWQIMPKTARRLGLKLNATIDERFDPEAATEAAARYLKKADKNLSEVARESNPFITRSQLNPFIITSYNYGVSGMMRAMRQVSPNYMAVLNRYKSPRFQIAVKNFYASFLAARHVARNSKQYFGDLTLPAKARHQIVVLKHATSVDRIEKVFGLDEKQLRPLNRALTKFVWRGWRLIPAGYRLRLPARDDHWWNARTKLAAMAPERVISGGDRYTVRRGDTACGIARAVRVNCGALIRANHLGRKALIYPGQKLLIPRKLVVAAGGRSTATTYRVRSGDTACRIAKRFGVNCLTLLAHNRMAVNAIIYPGQVIAIPGAIADGRPGGLNADNLYIVRRGDSACRVAKLFAVNCRALIELNQLDAQAVIHPGQKLQIPGLVAPQTSSTAASLAQVDSIAPRIAAKFPHPIAQSNTPQTTQSPKLPKRPQSTSTIANRGGKNVAGDDGLAADADGDVDTLRNLLDTLPELGVRVTDVAGRARYSVHVEADETLAHFADWLGIDNPAVLRRLNNLRTSRSLAIGMQLILPVRDAEMAERFEQQRTDYHQVLSESLKEHYDLVGIESHPIQKGDSPWALSEELGFPLWLLYRLNPVLREAPLVPGQMVLLPKLKAKA